MLKPSTADADVGDASLVEGAAGAGDHHAIESETFFLMSRVKNGPNKKMEIFVAKPFHYGVTP
jgi:hypothetical protein